MNTKIEGRNRFIILRHAESEANRRNFIVCKPEHDDWAKLTSKGIEDLRRSTRIAIMNGLIDPLDTIIFSSQLRRCRDSLEIVAAELDIPLTAVQIRWELNERDFGRFEFHGGANYKKVYANDRNNPDNKEDGVESISEVQTRVLNLIQEIEETYHDKTVLLVTHKDIGEILEATIRGIPPHQHRDRILIPKIQNSEFREMPI